MRGMSVAHAWQNGGSRGYGTPTSEATLEELSRLGVNWISLTPFGFSRTLSDTTIRSSAALNHAESAARVRAEIQAAHARGLRVLLKPHLWIGTGAWCGTINPGSEDGWRAWEASYQDFIVGWAELAEASGVELFAVGTELGSMVRERPSALSDLAQVVRAHYHGKIVYAANWDEVARVGSAWQSFDFVGVQLYAPLARAQNESPESMRRRLDRALDGFERVSREVGRPWIVTEIGYTATARTLLAPHVWPEHALGADVDTNAQATAYRIAFEALHARRTLAGIFVWKWFTDPTSNEEGSAGFSPRGRPALAVLRSAFGARECVDANATRPPLTHEGEP